MPDARLDELTRDPQNRRAHNDRNLALITESLRDVGPSRSIVVDEDSTILAGNGVVEAASRVGLSRVLIVDADADTLVAVRRSGLTPEKKRALALYDNRASELAEWNYEQLADDKRQGLPLQPYWTDAEEAVLLGQRVAGADWTGMPEFEQPDAEAFRTLKIHFATQAAVDAFAALVGQPVTDKTKYLWFPRVEPETMTVEYRTDDAAAVPAVRGVEGAR